MGRASTLPKRLQPMLATLTDGPFDNPDWIFEDKYDGFRMVAKVESRFIAATVRLSAATTSRSQRPWKALKAMP
jgi:ATP-dependent DNA ligase